MVMVIRKLSENLKMIYLCIDTAYKYLSLSLIKDKQIIAAYDEICFKHQSEELFVRLKEIYDKAGISPLDIDAICISKGPGSYTGVRIAMTLAKTIGDVSDIDIYTISTLRLYANNKPDTLVLMDAKGNRAYNGLYDQGSCIIEDNVAYLDDLKTEGHDLVGDLSLLGKEDFYYPISECFLNNIEYFEKVEDVSGLVPNYLKENKEYLK